MKINYTYTFEDYEAIHRSRRKARKFAWLRDLFVWLLILANFGFGCTAMWLYFQSDEPLQFYHVGNLLIGFSILAAIYIAGPLVRRWYLKQQLIEDKNVSVEVVEDGLIATFGENRTQTNWAGFIRADEDKSHFTLWINKLQAYSIPKRALGPGEEATFRQSLIDNIENRTLNDE